MVPALGVKTGVSFLRDEEIYQNEAGGASFALAGEQKEQTNTIFLLTRAAFSWKPRP